jgi:hypothetical protein
VKFIENTYESALKKLFTSLMGLQPNTEQKILLNITCHNEDFRVPAEWHFFVTSQGSSAYGSLCGTLKRYADQWSQSGLHNLNSDSVTQNEYKEEGLLSVCNI